MKAIKAVLGFMGETVGYWLWLIAFWGILGIVYLAKIPGLEVQTRYGTGEVTLGEVTMLFLALFGLGALAIGLGGLIINKFTKA